MGEITHTGVENMKHVTEESNAVVSDTTPANVDAVKLKGVLLIHLSIRSEMTRDM